MYSADRFVDTGTGRYETVKVSFLMCSTQRITEARAVPSNRARSRRQGRVANGYQHATTCGRSTKGWELRKPPLRPGRELAVRSENGRGPRGDDHESIGVRQT